MQRLASPLPKRNQPSLASGVGGHRVAIQVVSPSHKKRGGEVEEDLGSNPSAAMKSQSCFFCPFSFVCVWDFVLVMGGAFGESG